MALHACKWDPQIADVETLAPFPILLTRSSWSHLAQTAERLGRELLNAEAELLQRPDLHRTLGLPWHMRRSLRAIAGAGPREQARSLRCDFHWTTTGWRISEVNSDVPGGYAEAFELPRLFAATSNSYTLPGNPGERWLDSIRTHACGDRVALLAAPGFLEDQQVIAYLSMGLQKSGLRPIWSQPEHLAWHDGRASIRGGEDLGAIVRFYQAEWLRRSDFRRLGLATRTLVANPVHAVLTESKRFPLVWEHLATGLTTWQHCLPQTVDPRDAVAERPDEWVIKSAFGNTGDDVSIFGLESEQTHSAAVRRARRQPLGWIAQRRFEALALPTPAGPMYPCLGVYIVDGEAAGIYGRLNPRPLIDYASIDVAVLVESGGEPA